MAIKLPSHASPQVRGEQNEEQIDRSFHGGMSIRLQNPDGDRPAVSLPDERVCPDISNNVDPTYQDLNPFAVGIESQLAWPKT